MKKKNALLCILLLMNISCGKGESTSSDSSSEGLENLSSTKSVKKLSFPQFNKEETYETFSQRGLVLPKEDSRYFNVSIIRDTSKQELNYTTFNKGLRRIVISGKKIIIEKGHVQGIYELISKTTDVIELVINAEEVEIKSHIHLAAANVTINSKLLSFEFLSTINVTPISKTETPKMYMDGANGLNGGSITLNVEEILEKHFNKNRLIGNGGHGQKAGPGKNGARGSNAHLIKGYHFYQSEICSHETRGDYKILFGWLCSWNSPRKGRPSTSGQPAVVGGKPGEPGKAGSIFISIDNKLGVSLKGGRAGVRDSVRQGGPAGTPNRTCAYKNGDRSKSKTYNCVVAAKGANANPKTARVSKSKDNHVVVTGSSWLTDAYINAKYLYAKDLFMANAREESIEELVELEEVLEKTAYKSLLSMKISNQAHNIKMKYQLNQDYFGKSILWVPNLGFEANFSLFKSEIKRSIKLLYLIKVFTSKMSDLDTQKAMLVNLQKELIQNIDRSRNDITNLMTQTVLSTEVYDDYKVAEDEFKSSLIKLEQEIHEMAKNNLRVPFMDRAVKIIAAASKSIPVGQPTFLAIGTGLEYLNEMAKGNKSAFDIISDVPSLMDTYEKFDWKGAKKDLKEKLRSLDPSELSKLTDMKDKVAYFEDIKDFASPIFTQIAKQKDLMNINKVSKSALDDEMNKIKSSHKIYQEVINKLNVLLLKQEVVQSQLLHFDNHVTTLLDAITDDYTTIAYSYDDIFNNQIIKKAEFNLVLNTVANKEEDNLEYYHFLLRKSFQYRMLVNPSQVFKLSATYEKMEEFIRINTSSIDNAVELLSVGFQAEISAITRKIVNNFIEGNSASELIKEYSLNEDEMQALNDGQEIYIDMTGEQFYGEGKEDVRLIGVDYLKEFEVEDQGAEDQGDGSREIEILTGHIGKSILQRGDTKYLFEHGDHKKHSNMNWTTYINLETGHMDTSKSSLNDQSLLSNMLGLNTNTIYYVRPGARTFLSIKMNKSENVKIAGLVLKINYSYLNKL